MKRMLCFILSLFMMVGMSVNAFAITNSSGSTLGDFTSVGEMDGEDTNYVPPKLTEYDTLEAEEVVGSHNVAVYVSQGSTYSVKIPKQVVLDGKTSVGEYVVGVKGEIETNKKVTIVPYINESMIANNENKIVLSTTYLNKGDIYAAISQDKTEVLHSEVDSQDYIDTAKITGTITAENLTVGTWEGSFVLKINLEDAT